MAGSMNKQINQSTGALHPDCPSQSTFPLDDLPYDLLVDFSLKVPARDVLQGLCGTGRRIHGIFREDGYWKERIRRTCPEFFETWARGNFSSINQSIHLTISVHVIFNVSSINQSSKRCNSTTYSVDFPFFKGLDLLSPGPENYWAKRSYYSEKVQQAFSNPDRAQCTDLWSSARDRKLNNDEDFGGDDREGMCDVSCVSFCQNGKMNITDKLAYAKSVPLQEVGYTICMKHCVD